jgi:hypothetical protein
LGPSISTRAMVLTWRVTNRPVTTLLFPETLFPLTLDLV